MQDILQDNHNILVAVAIGLVGLGIFWYISQGKGSGKAKVIVQGTTTVELDKIEVLEAVSDLLRNVRSIVVVVGTGGNRRKLVDVFPQVVEMKASKEMVAEFRNKFQAVLESLWKENCDADIELPAGLTEALTKLLTVTPSMNCLLAAKLLPAMYQPMYTISLLPEIGQVRCITDGFVGMPVLGPADPNKKYTNQSMRVMSEDLVQCCFAKSNSMNIVYEVKSTSFSTCEQLFENETTIFAK